MLDEKDLQAIAALMSQQKQEIIGEVNVLMSQQKREIMGEVGVLIESYSANIDEKLQRQKREIIGEVGVLMESYFDPKFDALAEKLNPVPREAIDIMEDRLDDVEKTVELHSRQIEELKKAQ